MRSLFCTITILVFCVASAAAAGAGVMEWSDTVSLQPTPFDTTVSIPKYNGTDVLTCVEWILSGHIEGLVMYENLGASPATVRSELKVEMTLSRPDDSMLVVSVPIYEKEDDLPAFDGTMDFDGPSGRTYDDVTADKTENTMFSEPADLALFSGSGNIELPITAVGESSVSGPGNVISMFDTDASAEVTVKYHFTKTAAVPEPATLGLLGLGLIPLIRRKRN